MSDWTHAAICAALGIGTDADADGAVYTGISTDTRSLEKGQVFVALPAAGGRRRGRRGGCASHPR
jgi:UDP-N-acetylmuramyl pentapeptide synthase